MMMEEEEFLKKYTGHLNEKQLEAVQAVDGPVLLLAVPGSGKTTVLINRLGFMIYCRGIRPEEILTLTYTIAATKDMSRRFEEVFGTEMHERMEFRTINGICSKVIARCGRMMGQDPFELVTDEGQLIRVLTNILKSKLSEYPTESEVKAVKSRIAYCKNMMLSDDEIKELSEKEDRPLFETFKEYNAYLRSNSQMDYDDQMVYGYRLLKMYPELLDYYRKQFRYICVDEAQDTSKIQHMIIKLLAGESDNLFMVGDEDQSIYGFRAAYPEALLDFEKDHPGARVLVMDKNYRSNAKIVSSADKFIQHNKARHEKHMVAEREAGADIRYMDMKNRSAQYVYLAKVAEKCDAETAVLYRENESALPLISLLDRQKVGFRLKSVDMPFFTNRVVLDVTSIMRLAMNPYDTELFMRIYYKFQTFLKKHQAEEMCRISTEKHIPVLEAAEKVDSINGMTKGKCRGVATNLRCMLHEEPAKAIFRIENPMGYLEYLDRCNIDAGKLYILKQLAYSEHTIKGFLDRLDYLQGMIKNRENHGESRFIMSTIHSSKGLEYDRVYLLDVFDGQFPAQIPSAGIGTDAEKKQFEEERRLFYVGMTRAKNELTIFRVEGESSRFIQEVTEEPKKKIEVRIKQPVMPAVTKTHPYSDVDPSRLKSDFNLIIGERVVHSGYGPGTVDDVDYDDGKAKRFTVKFDDGSERIFGFPAAFSGGVMQLESGESVDITVEKTEIKKRSTVSPRVSREFEKFQGDSYESWAAYYPDYVVIKKEGYYWTCRGESAKVLHDILGYKLTGSDSYPKTGGPSLDRITGALKRSRKNYVAIEGRTVIEKEEF